MNIYMYRSVFEIKGVHILAAGCTDLKPVHLVCA